MSCLSMQQRTQPGSGSRSTQRAFSNVSLSSDPIQEEDQFQEVDPSCEDTPADQVLPSQPTVSVAIRFAVVGGSHHVQPAVLRGVYPVSEVMDNVDPFYQAWYGQFLELQRTSTPWTLPPRTRDLPQVPTATTSSLPHSSTSSVPLRSVLSSRAPISRTSGS